MKKKYKELLEKFLAKNENDLEKMSRPRLQFPNLNIPTRLDQEIKPIGTERQKNIHARTVAETATRTAPSVQRITDPKIRQAVVEDARKDVVKQVKGSFGRGGTMGHIIPVAGKQYGAALVGKEYSKYDPALKDITKEKEAAKMAEYENKYDKWKQELQSKPQGSTDYYNHLGSRPNLPRKSPIPKTDTKKLSPEAQIARGKAQEMITEHEAAHMAFGHIKNKYPEKYQGIMRHLMGSFSPEVQNALISATAKRYNPKSPHFYEEVVNHARDILVDQRMRDNFLRNTKGDQKLISGVKQGWNEAVKRAKKLTPEFGKSELNKAPKERLSGITTGKLKQLTEDQYHNPDTGLELVPEAVHQEIARRAENKAPKMIADYKRKLKPQKPSGENPEDWFGKGAKGDWQKEGYKISHTEHFGDPSVGDHIYVMAHDNKGKQVGGATLYVYPNQLYPDHIEVIPTHRRKGIGSAMYAHAEKAMFRKTGQMHPVIPSESQTKYAQALHAQPNRPFGKSELNKVLPTAPKVNLNPEHGKIIANAYENMKHEPNNPHVKAAYNALAHETGKQYQNLLNQGYKFSPMKPGMENPYKTSKDMHADIANNKHLWYFPTEQGYGSEGDAPSDHPLLAPSKFKDKNGKVMPHNDVFRAVHDIMGHHLGGQSGFGPKGEHQAYLTHKKTYSPLAQKALASETLMQNSWVNFGPHAAHNRANPQNTIFADQKAGLPPDNIINGRWHE